MGLAIIIGTILLIGLCGGIVAVVTACRQNDVERGLKNNLWEEENGEK